MIYVKGPEMDLSKNRISIAVKAVDVHLGFTARVGVFTDLQTIVE